MPFKNLSLDPKLIKALSEAGYSKPTKIQARAIPEIMNGHDIRGSAQTGTGKTAAFLLPLLNHLITKKSKPGKGPRALILLPTRELAMQIANQAQKYSKYLTQAKAVCINGGVSYQLQSRQLSKPYEILIATPGRLVDYIKQKKIDFSRLEILVLDEADRMLDMGFQEAVDRIVKALPKERQTLLFSATFDNSIKKLSDHLLNKPVDIVIHLEKEKHENITQHLHYVDNIGHKNRLLSHLLDNDSVQYSIVFTATKRHADTLARELNDKGHQAKALHGDMDQRHRAKTIQKLKDGKINTLVATDVAARGLDVQHITHVINFDLPRNVEDYVHRIGRTGRAGASGIAHSFAAQQDKGLVQRIEKFTGHSIDVTEIEGFEPTIKEKKSKSSKKRTGFNHSKKSKGRFSRFKSKANTSFGNRFKKKRSSKQRARA